MATFTISLSGSTVVNGSKSWTVSDTDVQTLINYLEVMYNVSTPSAALLAWVQDFVSTTVNDVRQKNTIQQPPPPLSFT